MAQSYTPTTFAAAVLKRIGAPVNRSNLQALVGWEKAEGGHWANNARYNPLNTTQNMPGSGDTGSQGNISSYKDWEQGLAATVKTLKNGLYPNILAAFKKGNNPASVGAAVGNSPWCPGCGAYATRVIQQTKIPGSVATRLSAQQGGLAQTVTPRPSTPLASAAAVSTPPSVRTVTSTKTVQPDTSAQGFIAQMAAQMAQGTTPAPRGGLDAGQSKYLSQAPVPLGAGITPAAPGIGSELAGLSQLVGPSNFTTSKQVVTPGHVAKAPSASAAQAQPAAQSFLPKGHSQLFELIHKSGSGPGYGVKNGKLVNGSQVFSGVWDGHADHVHVAAGPNTIVDVGKMAQDMGLHVGENPHFGGVNPVHVNGSYHYKGEAIDVSGDPKLMDQFAHRVEQAFGLAPGNAGAARSAPAPSGSVKGAKPGSPVARSTGIVQGPHRTDGLPGFPAIDYGARAGTPVVAPVSGTVYKLSGHTPANGPVGPGKAFGWSVYIRGKDGREYFLTHLGTSQARVGESVSQGQRIGTVADFEKYGTPDHIHMGVRG